MWFSHMTAGRCGRGGFTRWVCRQTRLGIVWRWPLARRPYTVGMSANAARHCIVLAVGAAALHGEYVGKRGLALYGVDRRCGGFTRPVMPANAARHDIDVYKRQIST